MITSTGSSQVKHVIQLLSKGRTRKEFKEYVVEGTRMVSEIPLSALVKVYLSETYEKNNGNPYGERAEVVSDNVYNHMSDTKTPQGIMAVVKMKEYSLKNLLAADSDASPLIICAENLQDPGNMGTIIRMGEAAGATGVLISSNSVDIYNPKVIRSTMGSIFRVPHVIVDDFTGALDELKKFNVKIFAAHLDGNISYTGADYTGASAFIIGNEGNGLTAQAAAKADCLVKIPMHGEVESLNAAIACTVLAFEAARQRTVLS